MPKEIEIAGRWYGLVEETLSPTHTRVMLTSDEGKSYELNCRNGAWTCDCPDSVYRRPHDNCKHAWAFRRRAQSQKQETSMSEQNSGTLTAPSAPVPTLTRTPTPTNALPSVTSQSGRTQLCLALAKAQGAIGRVGHDARNEFHRYDYTSSEAVIEAAKQVLSENSLCLLPLEETLSGHEKEGENRFELECKFVLLHTSGEQVPLLRHWPVCPEKGRPLDKATAAASTLCLAYLLRDLLLIPRVNPADEVAARDDRPRQGERPEKPKKADKPARPEEPKDGAGLLKWLESLDAWAVERKLCDAGDVRESVLAEAKANRWADDVTKWLPEQVRLAIAQARHIVREMQARKKTETAA